MADMTAHTVTVTDAHEGSTPLVIDVNDEPAHLRSFDAEAGDEAWWSYGYALAAAMRRVVVRGCRQQVRKTDRAWIVQDI